MEIKIRKEWEADVAVIGGGTAGVFAAISSAAASKTISFFPIRIPGKSLYFSLHIHFFAVTAWLHLFLHALRTTFGKRIWFVGSKVKKVRQLGSAKAKKAVYKKYFAKKNSDRTVSVVKG